jgi:hypothetical protein
MQSFDLYFQRSRSLFVFRWVIHLLMMAAIWCLSTPMWLVGSGSVMVVISLFLQLLCWRKSSLGLFVDKADCWRIQLAGSDVVDVTIAGLCRMTGPYLLIPVKGVVAGRSFRKNLLVMKDSLPEVDYRLLRMLILLAS